MKKLFVAASLASLLGMVGCSGPNSETADPVKTDQVDLPRSYRFEPTHIEVEQGAEVTWANNDQFTHTVRLLESEEVLGQIEPGEKLTHSFERLGTYRYDCSLHPTDMKGTVVVK